MSKKDMDIAKLQKQKEEQEALQREAEEKAAAEKKLAIELKERDGQLAQSSAIIESYNRWVVAKVTRMKSLQEVIILNKSSIIWGNGGQIEVFHLSFYILFSGKRFEHAETFLISTNCMKSIHIFHIG